jgi:hypothetical protein
MGERRSEELEHDANQVAGIDATGYSFSSSA